MLSHNQLHQLHAAGIQTDMFGRKLHVGDTVLCKGYMSMDKNCFATIKKVNKKSIVVDVDFGYWDWGQRVHNPPADPTKSHWERYYPDKKYISGTKEMKRAGYDTMLIPADFKEQAIADGMSTIDQHPEVFI